MRINYYQLQNPKLAPWFWGAIGLTALLLLMSAADSER